MWMSLDAFLRHRDNQEQQQQKKKKKHCHIGLSPECRTKHPTDKTPHVHFGICGQKPPHVFFKADKTPHAQ